MNDASAGYTIQYDEHSLVREQLAEYAAELATGATGGPVPRGLAAHLERCRQCRQWYAEVVPLAGDVYSGAIEAAPGYPVFDLGFLKPARRPALLRTAISSIGSLVIELPVTLLATLRSQPLAGALRGASLFSERIQEVERINIAVTVEIVGRRQDFASLRVDCELLSREPDDQAGALVLLRSRDLTREAVTGAAGSVVFSEVPLAALPEARIEVIPDYKP